MPVNLEANSIPSDQAVPELQVKRVVPILKLALQLTSKVLLLLLYFILESSIVPKAISVLIKFFSALNSIYGLGWASLGAILATWLSSSINVVTLLITNCPSCIWMFLLSICPNTLPLNVPLVATISPFS